ncbi:uncharacterized protein LOC112213930 isoform X3 [Bombus impatiens]|uniref:Uncharacterized protein LOC112213930 isoform X3 n=1 Tax=Bombus impatiens TaxID=132113 RepID=A0A6P8L8C0_BOMIM|nr:uncharacterized protein LOC112213930 isoform X3 [Bombus impatiens]
MDKRSERVSRFKRAGVSEARGAVSGTFALFIPDRAADESRGSLAPEGRFLAFFGSQRRHDPTLSAKGIRQRSYYHTLGRDSENAASASDEENQSGHSSDRDPTMDPGAANSKDPRTSTAIVPIKIFPPLARNALDFLPDREERTQKK